MKRTLLVVEDDPAMREVWEVLFSQRGWDVTVTATAAGGLASLDPAPDYLILDLLLPDQGGEVILRKVRDAGLKTRVVVTTAADAPSYLRAIKALTPDAVFAKPINVADVWAEGNAAAPVEACRPLRDGPWVGQGPDPAGGLDPQGGRQIKR